MGSGAGRILPFHPPGQSPAADGFGAGLFSGAGAEQVKAAGYFFFFFLLLTGQKHIFSCVCSLAFHEVCTSTGESMGSVVKT